ncbi:MAG: 5-methylcytosine-specific restriction protein A, partial [Myxococcota bacterium]
TGPAWNLNSRSARLHRLDRGDSLWAFTRRLDGAYALAAELVVRAKVCNHPGHPYGPYGVWGDHDRSRYFDVTASPAVETVVRALSVRPKTLILGRSFQGPGAIRLLTATDHAQLVVFADTLPLYTPLHGLDDHLLEQASIAPRPRWPALISDVIPPRRRATLQAAYSRSRVHVLALRQRYAGRCQVCGWRAPADFEVCEGHHVHWLSRGGQDDTKNMVLLCPNHHRLVHAADAPLDFSVPTPRFLFSNLPNAPLQLNSHL